jgi:hypothetical protein
LGRRRLGLDGREHGSTLDWYGAKQACQHQPSNDVADAPSMCVIVLIPSLSVSALSSSHSQWSVGHFPGFIA